MSINSKVYITHEPLRREGTEMVSTMDFRPAAEYGKLIVCLTGAHVSMNPVPMVEKLRSTLRTFCDDDYLLCAGDPSAIAVASAIASKRNGGKFKLLKWDKNLRMYIQIDIDINSIAHKATERLQHAVY